MKLSWPRAVFALSICLQLAAARRVNLPSRAGCTVCAFQDLGAGLETTSKSPQPSDFLLLTISSAKRFGTNGAYRENRAAWGCYGNRQGVPVRAVDPKDVPGCPRYGDWFFRRLCTVATILEGFAAAAGNGTSRMTTELGLAKTPRWIVHLDGDTVAFNGNLSLSELAPAWKGKDMVFYERFRNGEIAAGNYVARTSQRAASFLRGWEAMRTVAEGVPFSNGDNGALHLYMITYLQGELVYPQGNLANASAVISRLRSHYQQSHNIGSYDRYVAAAKLALGPRRAFEHVLIQRRGHGFCVDDDLYDGVASVLEQSGGEAARFLCVHGEKSVQSLVREVGRPCVTAMEHCKASLMSCPGKRHSSSHMALVPAVLAETVDRMSLGKVNDIRDCWPNCPTDVPGSVWAQMQRGLQENADCSPFGAVEGCCCLEAPLGFMEA